MDVWMVTMAAAPFSDIDHVDITVWFVQAIHAIGRFHGRSIGQTRQHNLKSTNRVGGQADPPQRNFAHFNGAPCEAEKNHL